MYKVNEIYNKPYDVSAENGEMIFVMNLVFGQRERKRNWFKNKTSNETNDFRKNPP